MLKKSIAHILLIVFVLQLFGMSAVYFSQRYAIKQSASKIIQSNASNNFAQLKLTKLEFQLAKFEENELFINGQLYDVASSEFRDGFYFVKALHDQKEESFLKKTIDWFDASRNSKSSLPKLIFKTFFNPVAVENYLRITFDFHPLNEVFDRHAYGLSFVFIQPQTPPPLSFC